MATTGAMGLVLTGLVCLSAVSARPDHVPYPVLPLQFITNFTQYWTPDPAGPPYKHTNGVPPPYHEAARAASYYDHTTTPPRMVEHYFDECVFIWAQGFRFPCKFLDTHGETLFITYNTSSTPKEFLPGCCVFGDPWLPPPPNFLEKTNATFMPKMSEGSQINCSDINYFKIDVPPPAGPFYFPFFVDGQNGKSYLEQTYASFTFPTLEGWAVQNYHNIRLEPPPEEVFERPDWCPVKPKACPPLGGIGGAYARGGLGRILRNMP